MTPPMHVMAGVLIDPAGRVLLAQRPPGKHLAGAWEFPGGKREPGESPQAALQRELFEELGIRVDPGRPLIRIPWRYGQRQLLLDAWLLSRWHGTPRSMEGQALRWCAPDQVDPALLAPADRPILQALRLPPHYLITPARIEPDACDAWLAQLQHALDAGGRLLQLHLPRWPPQRVRDLAFALLPLAHRHGAKLLLDGDVEGALLLGEGVGVQLTGAQLVAWRERPLPWGQPVGASCHDAAQLQRAGELGVDFATLSPVAGTADRVGRQPMGWATFERLAEAAALPVYALGGMQPDDLAVARQAAAQGIAGGRGFWPA
jgi:8-oxo-dGTP diphosphatase